MPMVPFDKYFLEVAEEETRTILVLNSRGALPDGQYGFREFYCDEPGCDCRRVVFQVFEPERDEIVATIGWGWEDESFYARASGSDGEEMKGPFLEPFAQQSEYAQQVLELCESELLSDSKYVERLERHYRMVKDAVKREPQRAIEPKAKRNEPCPCGSGKKFKKCCGA